MRRIFRAYLIELDERLAETENIKRQWTQDDTRAAVSAGIERGDRFGHGRHARNASEAQALRFSDDHDVAVRHDDELATCIRHTSDIAQAQYRACTAKIARAEFAREPGNAIEWIGRV